MIGFFRISGVLSIVILMLITLEAAEYPLVAIVGLFFATVFGLTLLALADVLEKLDYLTNKLNILFPMETDKHLSSATDEEVPQVICPKCSTKHDFDYPRCPNCGYSK